MAGRSTVSLCMIARDAADDLERCLRSVRSLVDETILVDTGSTDTTAFRAASLGATVYHLPWTGDFSAPRNWALQQARGEWILVLDADEALHPDDGPELRRILEKPGAEGFFLPVLSFLGAVPADDYVVDYRLSLFRNRIGLRYQGALHESVLPALHREGLAVGSAAIRILHYGYLDGARARKRGRNRQILQKALPSRPQDPFLHYAGAAESMEEQDLAGAVRSLRVCRSAWDPAVPYWPDAVKKEASCLLDLGQAAEALTLLEEGIRHHPDFTDLHFLRGWAQLSLGRPRESWRCFRHCLQLGEAPFPHATWGGVGSFRALSALGETALAAGHPLGAARLFRRVLRAHPDLAEAREGLGRALAQLPPGPAAVWLRHAWDTTDGETAAALARLLLRTGAVQALLALLATEARNSEGHFVMRALSLAGQGQRWERDGIRPAGK